MFLAPYYWGFSIIEVQGPHKRCKGLLCVQGPHLLPFYLYILMIITMTWCKGLNERCKGHNEWCKGLWCVQGPHHLPFYLITNDNQYRGSLHCSLAPCYLWEKGKRARCQRAMDLFSYMKILGKPIKKQVNINQCKYVCMELVRTCWENWQYALTMYQ